MKRLIICTFAVLLICLSVRMTIAAVPEVDSDVLVYDYAGLLTANEITELSKVAAEQSKLREMDFVIVFTGDAQGLLPEQYAKDFFIENGFGQGDESDGLILYINMTDRDIFVGINGGAWNYFDENDADALYMLAAGSMNSGADSPAYVTTLEFLRLADSMIEYADAHSGDYVNPIPGEKSDPLPDIDLGRYEKSRTVGTDFAELAGIALLIGVGAGLLTVGIMYLLHRRALSKPPDAAQYMIGNLRVTHSRDIFLHSRVTTVRKAENNNKGGGGRGGFGGGGRSGSFGGRGGKF